MNYSTFMERFFIRNDLFYLPRRNKRTKLSEIFLYIMSSPYVRISPKKNKSFVQSETAS